MYIFYRMFSLDRSYGSGSALRSWREDITGNSIILILRGNIMGQSTILLAFRKHLKKRGYTDIHIYNTYQFDKEGKRDYSFYCVRAVEPLSKKEVKVTDHLLNFDKYMR